MNGSVNIRVAETGFGDIRIGNRRIGPAHPPLVIAEIGINHDGDFDKALRMIKDAANAGCECVKFQSHVIDDEMIPNGVVPANAKESIWNIMARCAFSEVQEARLKKFAESRGLIFLSTPFSRAAARRLHRLGVMAYKIGSGECNNYPLVDHIAGYGKPVILSTGMNDIPGISKAVRILKKRKTPYAILHCTSVYPTPVEMVRLGALAELASAFPKTTLGLSDHSASIYPCLGAVALGAGILEKHFTSDKSWPGPDVPFSIDPRELKELIDGSRMIHLALGGSKAILKEEAPTIAFAYASVVAIRDIAAGEKFTADNIWVKRPGTGEIRAEHYREILSNRARRAIRKDTQIKRSMIHA